MNSKFYEIFGHQKPVIGMIHTNSDSEMTMLELAQVDRYTKTFPR